MCCPTRHRKPTSYITGWIIYSQSFHMHNLTPTYHRLHPPWQHLLIPGRTMYGDMDSHWTVPDSTPCPSPTVSDSCLITCNHHAVNIASRTYIPCHTFHPPPGVQGPHVGLMLFMIHYSHIVYPTLLVLMCTNLVLDGKGIFQKTL